MDEVTKISFTKANKQNGETWSASCVSRFFVFVLAFSDILLKYKLHGVIFNVFLHIKCIFAIMIEETLLCGRLSCATVPTSQLQPSKQNDYSDFFH